ncbi:unnamed protein product [Rangifer tarandus platyrhynchus]|uniref:Uncharacterized protein n=1 Tax=Rangifer tarandus platyrhynchus TaxID=3082113 RepID=A0AC59ZDL3_RANTA
MQRPGPPLGHSAPSRPGGRRGSARGSPVSPPLRHRLQPCPPAWRKMSTCFGGLGRSCPPIHMTFEDVHDLSPVYLAHSPIPCRFLLACSRFY